MSSCCKQDLGSGFLVQITFDSVSKLVLPKTNKRFFFPLVILITQPFGRCDHTVKDITKGHHIKIKLK